MKKYKVTRRFINEESFIIEGNNRREAITKFRKQTNLPRAVVNEYEEIRVEDAN